MKVISNIGVHHFGPSGADKYSKSAHLDFNHINNAHKARWPELPSKMNPSWYVGYNIIIWPSGGFRQCRLIGEETAAQKGHNFDTVSICFAGNFTRGVEAPTEEQKATFQKLVNALLNNSFSQLGILTMSDTLVSIPRENIFPHRILQPNHTSCYGDSLGDAWARDLITPLDPKKEKKALLTTIRNLKRQLLELRRKLGMSLGAQYPDCSQADVRG